MEHDLVGRYLKAFCIPHTRYRDAGYEAVSVPWLEVGSERYRLVFNRLHPNKCLHRPVDEWRKICHALS